MRCLSSVGEDPLLHIASFLRLGELLCLRAGNRQLLILFNVESPIWKTIRPHCIATIAKRASVPALQFLNYLYCLTWVDVRKVSGASALEEACKTNDIPKINWLTLRFPYMYSELVEALECAAHAGNLESIITLVTVYNLTEASPLWYVIFVRTILAALRPGWTSIVRWLLKIIHARSTKITPVDAVCIFRAACGGPSLRCLIEVNKGLRISRKIIRTNERIFLGDACFAGMSGNARWLIVRFGITPTLLRESAYYSLRRACDGRHLWLAMSLIAFMKITLNELIQFAPTLVYRHVREKIPWVVSC